MFVIKMLDGEEIHASDADRLAVNPDSGVLTVSRTGRYEETTTHYSPAAWKSVTYRVKKTTINTPVLPEVSLGISG